VDYMLRIITQPTEAETELGRIKERFQDPALGHHLETVLEVLATVKRQGNQALVHYTLELDKQVLNEAHLKVNGSELDAAYQQISKELLDSIRCTVAKMEKFHRLRLAKSWVHFQEPEIALGRRYQPFSRAGIYLFDGSRAHLSILLKQAIPAKVAGVKEIILTAPPGQDEKIHPALLVAAQEAGITDIYRLGGPQAIAALAYGTETIPKVEVITGPGDVYVTLAKKQVSDRVRIEEINPRSELVIIADEQAPGEVIALDLLAQAQQHPLAAAILLTTDLQLAQRVNERIILELKQHSQDIFTEKAIAHYGLAIVVESLGKALELSNALNPTHVQIMTLEPWELMEQVRQGGTILLGNSTPKFVGDYLGNISTETFLQMSQVIDYSAQALQLEQATLETLAAAEEYQAILAALRARSNL
jgi:histidinol dehydrogenase